MNTIAKERLEKAFRDDPPGDLTDSRVVRQMCEQNNEATRETMDRIKRMRASSLAQAFTKIIG